MIAPPPRGRIDSIDLTRGLVMIIMALDHVRDYFHNQAQHFAPEDLAQTDGWLFFTRWITHFCAPSFMFLAGTAAWLYASRGRSTSELSRFLWTRGLWLVFLELTIVAWFGWDIGINISDPGLAVIWALGCSMAALAVLVWLPWGVLLALSVGMIALHNTLDGVRPEQFGAAHWFWRLLHIRGPLLPGPEISGIRVGYPLIPWIAVMAAGYCFGRIVELEPDRRRRVLIQLGVGLTAAFVLLRWSNLYGDPVPWTIQPSMALTVVSFLNCQKYPPSLLYLLMTLGPMFLVLAAFERIRVTASNPLLVFGRVPLFYYLLHLPLLHLIAVAIAQGQYGRSAFMLPRPPSLRGPRPDFPADYGVDLWAVYLVWIAIVLVLYPVCRWYAGVKQRSRAPMLSYL
jgi:uncharacterized membrane protein